jgi:hypothetical protein
VKISLNPEPEAIWVNRQKHFSGKSCIWIIDNGRKIRQTKAIGIRNGLLVGRLAQGEDACTLLT